MHQYNFPPFSTGEARPLRGPGRREIGHGALAERSVAAVVPGEEDFPYVIRLVSEVLSSNGSTSMASVCGSTPGPDGRRRADQRAGRRGGHGPDHRRGGQVRRAHRYPGHRGRARAIWTSRWRAPQTASPACRWTSRSRASPSRSWSRRLQQAHEARLFILDKMLEVMQEPREDLSPFAPRIVKVQINPEKIGALIGPGGKIDPPDPGRVQGQHRGAGRRHGADRHRRWRGRRQGGGPGQGDHHGCGGRPDLRRHR